MLQNIECIVCCKIVLNLSLPINIYCILCFSYICGEKVFFLNKTQTSNAFTLSFLGFLCFFTILPNLSYASFALSLFYQILLMLFQILKIIKSYDTYYLSVVLTPIFWIRVNSTFPRYFFQV